jgi:hypothetical protein
VYFDQATILRQLGLAHDPNSLAGRISTLVSHPVTIVRSLFGLGGGKRGADGRH